MRETEDNATLSAYKGVAREVRGWTGMRLTAD